MLVMIVDSRKRRKEPCAPARRAARFAYAMKTVGAGMLDPALPQGKPTPTVLGLDNNKGGACAPDRGAPNDA